MAIYQQFQPGEYLPFEKDEVALRQGVKDGTIAAPMPPGMPPMDPDDPETWPPFMRPKTYTEEEIIAYNHIWNPYDPLYNDPQFARDHGFPSVPAYPAFDAMAPIMGIPQFPKDFADGFYYTFESCDIRYYKTIFAGDKLHKENSVDYFEDQTIPGSDIRNWMMGGEEDKVTEDGVLAYHIQGKTRECYRKYAEGYVGEKFDFTRNMASWTGYFPPAHVTTDADYERMKTIWDAEVMNHDDVPYWEDVPVGYELPSTCSDGPITYMHMMYFHQIGDLSIYSREELMDPAVRAVTFRDQWGEYLDETALHFGGRNIPGARGVFYNDTAARLIARVLTNFVGTKGRVSRFGWQFYPFFEELRQWPICGEEFNKVPGMEGRCCDRHGSQGDTVIGRAVVTDKYVNAQGEHCCEVMLWGEDLEGNIIQGCPSEIVLPSRADA